MKLFPHASPGSPLRQTALAVAAGALLGLSSGAVNAVDATFTGYTNGCFGLACVPAANSAPSSITLNGLTYTNATFSVTSAGGFAAIAPRRAHRTSTTSARSP